MFFSKFRRQKEQIPTFKTCIFQSKIAKICTKVFGKTPIVALKLVQNKKAIPYSDSSSKTASDDVFIVEIYCSTSDRSKPTTWRSSVRKILTERVDDLEWPYSMPCRTSLALQDGQFFFRPTMPFRGENSIRTLETTKTHATRIWMLEHYRWYPFETKFFVFVVQKGTKNFRLGYVLIRKSSLHLIISAIRCR